MKTMIYVFSGTGTSLAVAKKIGKELGDSTITSMIKVLDQNEISTDADCIGLVFPCYYGDLPQIVKAFVEKLKLQKSQYIFSVITAGGHAGCGFKFLESLLKNKGGKLDYSTTIVISSNYMVGWYYNMIMPTPEKLKQRIKTAHDQLNKIVEQIRAHEIKIEKASWLRYKLPQTISPKKYIADTRPWDQEFTTSDSCNGCGICKNVCPVSNIKMTRLTPEFTHNCQRCMACIQYCPQQAIQVNGKTMNKPKYHHPEISIREMSEFHKC